MTIITQPFSYKIEKVFDEIGDILKRLYPSKYSSLGTKKNNHNVVYYDMVYDSASKLETFLKENSVELVFNLIHGEGGEDGTVQSYLDSL